MNRIRCLRIEEIKSILSIVKEDILVERNGEVKSFDRLPNDMKDGVKGAAISRGLENLRLAVEDVDNCVFELNKAMEN